MPLEPINPLGGFTATPELPRPFHGSQASPISADVAIVLALGIGFALLKMATTNRSLLIANLQQRAFGNLASGFLLLAVWYCALTAAGLWLIRYLL